MQGKRDKNIYPVYGQYKYQGAIDGPLFPTNGLDLLVGAIGQDVVTGSVAPYTHTISQVDATLLSSMNSYTIQKVLGGYQSEVYTGCRINKYTLKSAATNTEVSFTADVMAAGVHILGTPGTASVINESPFVFAEASLSFLGTTLTTSGSATVTNLEIVIDDVVKEVWVMGNHNPVFLTPVARVVTAKLDLVFTSLNDATYGYLDKIGVTGTTPAQGALVVTFTHPVTNLSVQINLPQVNIRTFGDPLKMEEVIMQALDLDASLQISSGITIQATVLNNTASAF